MLEIMVMNVWVVCIEYILGGNKAFTNNLKQQMMIHVSNASSGGRELWGIVQ